MRIRLTEERKQQLVHSIQSYFSEQLDREIGELGARLLLDFFVKELGPAVYNQAVQDSVAFMQDKLIDLDSELYEPDEEPRSR